MKTIKLKYDSDLYINTNQAEIENLHIASSEKDLINGLFDGIAAQWQCRKSKRCVKFFKTTADKAQIAELNRHGVLCSLEGGLYSLAFIDGLPTHIDRDSLAGELVSNYATSRDKKGYIYK